MHSPAFAIAWQLWTRHRSGIVTALVTLAMALALSPLLPLVPRMIASSIVLVLVTGYFENLLLFTEKTGSFESGYPRRMYALPVPSRTLVGWPMLYGGGVVALLWVTAACLVYRPSGFQTPVLLPALGFAAVFVWFQVFAWAPIKNPMLKLVFFFFFSPLLLVLPLRMFLLWRWGRMDDATKEDILVNWALDALLSGITGPMVLTLGVTYIVLAYAVARMAIASDRRGDTWRVLPQDILHTLLALRRVRLRAPFRAPAEAQLWYEWDCHGFFITISSGILLFLMAVPTLLRRDEFPGDLYIQVVLLLVIPVVAFAGCLSFSIGELRPTWMRSRAFITFLATRPMSSGAMVTAKLRMTALSVLLLFATMVVELALWIVAGGNRREAGELWHVLLSTFPGWRAAAVLVLGMLTLLALAWSLMTASLPIVLAGRNSVHVGVNLAVIAGLMGIAAVVILWVNHPAYRARLLTLIPTLLAAATVIKVSVASLAFHAGLRRELIGATSVIATIAAALALAACAIALAALLSEAHVLPVPMSVVVLAIVLLVPLGRFALAVLALQWNRHR